METLLQIILRTGTYPRLDPLALNIREPYNESYEKLTYTFAKNERALYSAIIGDKA